MTILSLKITFFGHKGRVNDIQCSPFERNVFLSCGSDQEIRIYSLLHPYGKDGYGTRYLHHLDKALKPHFIKDLIFNVKIEFFLR